MALQQLRGALGLTNIKCPDDSVNAGGSDDCASIFVPVVGQGFSRWEGRLDLPKTNASRQRRRMNRYLQREMITSACRCSQVPHT